MTAAHRLTLYIAIVGAVAPVAKPPVARAQKVHEIRLEVNRKDETYRFSPEKLSVRPGDVLLSKAVSGLPHNVVFEASGLSPAARGALNAALPRRTADLTGPPMTQPGAEYRVVIPNLAPGTYRFFCLPHRAYDERGEFTVRK
jgi:plastocyanin